MFKYLLKRVLLLPLTLFVVILVNFLVINMAPGEDLYDGDRDVGGDASQSNKIKKIVLMDRHLQFREHFGLTLPVLINNWKSISVYKVKVAIKELVASKNITLKKSSFDKLKIAWGDRARFILDHLIHLANDEEMSIEERRMALDLFIRGAIKMGITGPNLSQDQKSLNQVIASDNNFLLKHVSKGVLTEESIYDDYIALLDWFKTLPQHSKSTFKDSCKTFFLETRFAKYMHRVVSLDFGTIKVDHNKRVVDEVLRRLKSSLVLSVAPMIFVFALSQLFGMIMASNQNRWIDHVLNFILLALFAIPVFISVPFIIDKLVINKTIPFTSISIPYHGLSSSKDVLSGFTSWQRIIDVITHCTLPFIAISYGSFAVQSRLSRSAFLEHMRLDYVYTAISKGLKKSDILIKHVGRNASITLITSLASSFGAILGGSLIVETLFEINGFGKFFYDAIINRDHNIILFSALSGSILSLLGYFIGDILYMILDPRVKLGDKG